MPAPVSLSGLLARGDVVAVDHGRLTITPASGLPVPSAWLRQHERPLLSEAGGLAGVLALEYQHYSVGNYSEHRAGGITLQFRCLVSGQEYFAIFNAGTKRDRATRYGKKGDALPKGQFRVGKGSAFYRFWRSTRLPYQSLSNLHQRMGSLGSLIFTASPDIGERLNKATLQPLTLTAEHLGKLASNTQGICKQATSNTQATIASKETPQSQQPRAFRAEATTGDAGHGKTVNQVKGHTGNSLPPELQTNEEWLADYDAARKARPG